MTRPGWLDEPHPGAPDTERCPGRYALHAHPADLPAPAEDEPAPVTERSPASEPLSERDRGREANVVRAVWGEQP